MGRRRRRSARERRFTPRPVPAGPREAQPEAPATPRETIRPRLGRPAAAQAAGQASAALLRAAQLEQAYVARDLRRIGIVAGGTLVLLAVATVVANLVLK